MKKRAMTAIMDHFHHVTRLLKTTKNQVVLFVPICYCQILTHLGCREPRADNVNGLTYLGIFKRVNPECGRIHIICSRPIFSLSEDGVHLTVYGAPMQ